ncbi:MAG TPA: AAA family ATPase [Cyclobacteriaceae bacterium]|nr:AAA family ATPase [Cyclobacteriaceae bacterium]
MIDSLRDALQQSPDNLPLRILLAENLLQAKMFAEAEAEYRIVLEKDPGNLKARRGLAKSYFEQGKYSIAIVVLEELSDNEKDMELLVLHAKSLMRNDERGKAMNIYRSVLALNPGFKDDELDSLRTTNSSSSAEQQLQDIENGFQEVERPRINFDDVGGMSKVKEEINIKIIQPLQYPDLYKAYGKKIGGGILLYGPPGCGKTHLARATAGQIKAGFISIGIHDVLDMWQGNSEKQLHAIFESARRQAPCVIFFDEIDALGSSRTDLRNSSAKMVINQFLSELDGVQSSNDGLLILGATNAPWQLDTAFRRPGRFDRIIFVQPPDNESRESILKIMLKEKPAKDIDYTTLAKSTAEFSGADLHGMVDIAIENKLREAFKAGVPQPLSTKDLLNAARQVKPSTREWFNAARNYALYANESGLYDEILEYLKLKK